METSAFDYHLPKGFIAQRPLSRRDSSRLLVLRPGGAIEHGRFTDLPGLFEPGDLLVLNDTRVWKARFLGRRASTGGRVEALFLEELSSGLWLAWTRSGGKLKPGEKLIFAGGELHATLVERRGEVGDVLRVEPTDAVARLSESRGLVPIPPYISRPPDPLDVAAVPNELGQKMAIDATTKLPGEHTGDWPKPAEMSEEIQQLVSERWEEYGLGPTPENES